MRKDMQVRLETWSGKEENEDGWKHMGMDQYLLIPFLVGWTSIYQLFWCSPGVQGFDPSPYEVVLDETRGKWNIWSETWWNNGYGGWYGDEKRGNEAPKTSHYFEAIYIWKIGDFMVV